MRNNPPNKLKKLRRPGRIAISKIISAASHKTKFAASAQKAAFAKRKRRGAGPRALLLRCGG